MKTLKDRNTVPPGGWKHRVAQTGYTISRMTPYALQQAVLEHLAANNIPADAGEVQRLIEAQICAASPKSCYEAHPAAFPPPRRDRKGKRKWTLAEVGRGIVAWLFDINEKNMVPMDQAARRASVCSACPLKVASDACQSCSATYQGMVRRVGRSRITPLSKFDLRICDACGCFQAVKVQLKLDAVLKRTPAEVKARLHPSCWILAEEKKENP